MKKIIIKTILFIFIFIILFFIISWFPSVICSNCITNIPNNENKIYLTFDDGPGEITPQVLDILKEHNVKATFFVMGSRIQGNEKIIKRIVNEGHVIGTHTMNHPFLITNYSKEIKDTIFLVKKITNKTTTLFRPPYGFTPFWIINEAKKQNQKIILWSVFPRDYKNNKETILKKTNNLKAGDIICLHDLYSKETLKALPELIKNAKEKNLTFDILNQS